MIKVYRIDENGYYIETVLIEDDAQVPEDCIKEPFPMGTWKPRYINGAWQNGMSQAEIEAIMSAPKPKSLEDEVADIKKQNVDLLYQLMMAGVL